MKSNLLLAIYFSCIYSTSFSQTPLKWGKVSNSEAKLTVCPYDSTAQAVVLADYGKITIDYGHIVIERHRRIKILDKKALDRASVSLPYFVRDRLENIDKIEAQTITFDKSGKAIVTEVPKNQIFDADAATNWREKRFAFPSVEVGSILEYKYRTISQNYTFPDGWQFQSDIPTFHSEMTVNILVQDMNYRVLLQGDRLTAKYQNSEKPVSTWVLDTIPALVEEPYVANRYDYAEKVGFQLTGYQARTTNITSGTEYRSMMTTWDKLGEEIITSTGYTNFLNRGGKVKDMLSQIVAASDPELVKVQKIYNYVRSTVTWNGNRRIFPEQMFAKFLESRQGNSAEVNLLLTLLLQEAGFQANPALISTRSHGKVQQSYAMLTQFNHVISCVTIAGKDQLLDATDPLRPYQLLAEEDLNWYAFVLNKPESRWVKIDAPQPAKEMVYADISLENPAKPVYNFSVRYEGYEAIDTRKKYHTLGEQKFIAQQKALFNDKKLVRFEQENQDKPDESLLHKYQLELEEVTANQSGTLYFQPVMWHHFQENPFKGTKRNLPIELDYPKNFQFVLNLRIPEGYQVQEIPKPVLFSLPDNMGVFRYQITVNESQLQLFTNVQFKAVFIPAYYYSHLQQFYDHVMGKYQEMIVLKKK